MHFTGLEEPLQLKRSAVTRSPCVFTTVNYDLVMMQPNLVPSSLDSAPWPIRHAQTVGHGERTRERRLRSNGSSRPPQPERAEENMSVSPTGVAMADVEEPLGEQSFCA